MSMMMKAPRTENTPCSFVTKIESADASGERFVVVRYYLDRPGYDIRHASARLWKNPPASCTAKDVATFLTQQGLVPLSEIDNDDPSLLVEIFLDKFESYMLLNACEKGGICFDFSQTTQQEPGILAIRFTDTIAGQQQSLQGETPNAERPVNFPRSCNTSQIGLFAFSMTVGLEMTEVTRTLVGSGNIHESYVLTWGPYAFFVSGLLQLIVGQWEVSRNNVYGATAFMAFGSFWLANGLRLILLNYFPGEIPPELLDGSDPWGEFIRHMYILLFACALFVQTLTINKYTTFLVTLLVIMLFGATFAGWSTGMKWIQMICGWLLSAWAFFVFFAEFTNEVYQRQVFYLFPWRESSSNEVFGAAGRTNTLAARAYKLRSASIAQRLEASKEESSKEETYTFHGLRAVQPQKQMPPETGIEEEKPKYL